MVDSKAEVRKPEKCSEWLFLPYATEFIGHQQREQSVLPTIIIIIQCLSFYPLGKFNLMSTT